MKDKNMSITAIMPNPGNPGVVPPYLDPDRPVIMDGGDDVPTPVELARWIAFPSWPDPASALEVASWEA